MSSTSIGHTVGERSAIEAFPTIADLGRRLGGWLPAAAPAAARISAVFADLCSHRHRPEQVGNKALFEIYRRLGFPTTWLPYQPIALPLFIIDRCNLRCGHCRIGNPGRQAGRAPVMTPALAARILDRFPWALSASLTGGEPLLHPQLYQLVALVHARRMTIHLPTNGLLLARHAARLAEARVEMINVSFYGSDPESFSALTGGEPRLFDQVVAGTAELVRQRRATGWPRLIRASFLCLPDQIEQVVAQVERCQELGVNEVRLHNLNCYGLAGFGAEQCLVMGDGNIARIEAALRSLQPRIRVLLPVPYLSRDPERACDMPFRMLPFDGRGDCGPCCVMGTGASWGNISDRQLWNGSALRHARRRVRDPVAALFESCRTCEELRAEEARVLGPAAVLARANTNAKDPAGGAGSG